MLCSLCQGKLLPTMPTVYTHSVLTVTSVFTLPCPNAFKFNPLSPAPWARIHLFTKRVNPLFNDKEPLKTGLTLLVNTGPGLYWIWKELVFNPICLYCFSIQVGLCWSLVLRWTVVLDIVWWTCALDTTWGSEHKLDKLYKGKMDQGGFLFF